MGRSLVALVFAAAACAGATQSQSTSETPAPGGWKELRILWDYGPCPSDGRSCHQVLTVQSNGAFIAAETLNPVDGGASEPTRRFAALDAQEVRELGRIVTPEFVAKLGSFPCAPSSDATIRLEIDDHKQEIAGCTLAQRDTAPGKLVELLERHRFATHDKPADRTVVPTGVGDPCNTATGCARGLQCVPSPCVVAPCTSGSCQKTS